MKTLVFLFLVVMLSTTAFAQPYNVGILVHGEDPDITETINHQGPTDWNVHLEGNVQAYTICYRGNEDPFFIGFLWQAGSLDSSFPINDTNESQVSFRLTIGGYQSPYNFAAVTYEGE